MTRTRATTPPKPGNVSKGPITQRGARPGALQQAVGNMPIGKAHGPTPPVGREEEKRSHAERGAVHKIRRANVSDEVDLHNPEDDADVAQKDRTTGADL